MNKINFNEGQTAVFLKDLIGQEYPAIAEVKRNKRVNGQRELTLSFLYTDINKDFMDKLEFGWKVLFKGEEYTITHTGSATDGKYMLIDVTAILSFFVELNGYYLQDSVEDKSSTAASYFNTLFQGTPFTYVLVDYLEATTLNYEDNQSKTQRFLYGIDRYEAEYKVQGKVAYIHKTVGHDKDVILHEDLNVNSVRIDVDASGFHTWAKGYGDLDEETGEYKLEVEYISPLAEKYGLIEGPAIKDGNFKHADALTNAVKKQVENSYTISTEVHAVDLTNNGYPEMILDEGDRIFLGVDRLNLNQQTRVMEIEELFDWEGNIIDASYVVGNEGIATRYKTQQYDSIRDFRDITTGRKKLEYNWLPDAVRRASEIINGNQDSLFKYGAGEIIGINQSNPNGYMRFNTDGIGFSRDGGKTYQTAMTFEGIVADAITAGTLRGIIIEGVEIYGGIIHSLNNENTFWNLETGLLRIGQTTFELGGGADIEFLDGGNRLTYQRIDSETGITRTAGMGVGTSINNRFPFVYLGATGTSKGNFGARDENWFSGFIANTTQRESTDGIGNSVIGYGFHVRDKAVGFTKGWYFNLNGSNLEFRPINTGSHTYDLGASDNRWNRVFTNGLRTLNYMDIRDTVNTNIGWRVETQYPGDGSGISIRGLNTGSYNYTLGKENARLKNVFSEWFTGTVSSSSSHNSKMNIEDLDEKEAFDYVDLMKLFTYYYIDSDFTNPYERRVGPIIEQLDPANEHLYKASPSTLDINSNLFMLMAAFKHYIKITDEQFEILKQRLEMLENGTTA